ncbi:serine/threonine-protein kinase [Streptomyces sp. H10-C2]|uniref:serine/threonine-protein kinase n=1 Tax=unclassified Streptomyces TaxID=2593676 RepID=UPI0024B89C33|nr:MULTISPECIES: serine/threonine-protein kinase [unclassified Streptomyces]MDJ0345660.1 serine/threonine-protein kinase [Streptomyces sp. PH10-H1]MDJ0373025.1 serine/threonine-protein kinase [Streptomyces sp. H10-C2]
MSGTNGDGHDERDDYVDGGIKPLAVSDPARIGPYLLLGRLGAGGMGRVFLARSDSGRTVAVKVVHEEHVSDEQFRARFRREIDAARRVGEQYTAPVLDAGPGDDPPWVATGYVPGLSLEQVVRRHGPLPTASLHALVFGLLKALKDIHDAGIVHRDLKPSNVMLTVDGTKVIDFGIARALETSVDSLLTSTGMIVGSPGFMSPEQVRGQRAGVKSDVFTLGCVLVYAATGKLPFGQGASNQHAVMFQIVEGEPDLMSVEDASLRALIARCLIKDPGQRPSVDELLDAPERTRPLITLGTWLPATVVAHLAQQSARLLDAEAAPLREEPVDRATVGLRSQTGTPEVMPAAAGVTTGERERRPRRRNTLIVLPIVAVLTVGGGTAALLHTFESGAGAGAEAKSRASSESATPAGSNSANTAGSSPATAQGATVGRNAQGGSGSSAPPGGGSSSNPAAGGSGSGGGSGPSGSGGGGLSGSVGSTTRPPATTPATTPAGSPPPAMTGYNVAYNNSCVGACNMPLTVTWSAVSRATRYDIHYTNKGSNFTTKNVDTILSTGGTKYVINGPYSGDEICVAVRAANKYGASAWAQTWCGTVPY